jgi:hypothetical protein
VVGLTLIIEATLDITLRVGIRARIECILQSRVLKPRARKVEWV